MQREVWCQECHARWKVASEDSDGQGRQGQLIHYDYPLADDTVPQYDQGGHAYIQSNAINSGGQDVESINSPEEDAGKLQCSQLECDPRLPGKPSITRLAWTQSKGHETPVSTPSSKTHREEIGTHAREALLQLPQTSMQILRVGTHRGEGAPRAGQPRHHEDDAEPSSTRDSARRSGEDRVGDVEEEVAGAGEGAQREAGQHRAAEATQRGDRREDADGRTSSSDAAAPGTSHRDPAATRPADLAVVCGRAGEIKTGPNGPRLPSGDCESGQGVQEDVRGTGCGANQLSLEEEEEEEVKTEPWNAPWCVPIGSASMLNNAYVAQLEDWDYEAWEKRVSPGYWIVSGNESKFHPGILPGTLPIEGELRAQVMKEVPQEEDMIEEALMTLKKGTRKRLLRVMNKNRTETPKIAEVYSEPRITAAQGAQNPLAFDLKNGYDFRREGDRRRCFKRLKDEDPDVLVLCPPCGPFSQLQAWNYHHMDTKRAMLILEDGVEHLEFAMRLFAWQVRRGRVAVFEHPWGNRSWQEEAVKYCLSLPEVEVVRGDQCQFGLRVRPEEELSKKSTGFMTNGPEMKKILSKQCQGDHLHQHLVGGRAKGAERYPEELCQAIIRGAQEDMRTIAHAKKESAYPQFDEEAPMEYTPSEPPERDLEDELD